MKKYFVQTDNVADLQNALGSILEFVYFMAEEFNNRGRKLYIDDVLRENNIIVTTEEL